MNYDLVWSKVLSKIQEEVTSVLYKTWFQETRLYKVEDNIATIIVPSEIHEKFLSERYQELLVGALGQVTNTIYELSFTLKDKVNDIEKISTPIVEKKEVEPSSNYKHASNLIKSYNFDNFVVGNSNKLAHAAALAVAQTPGETYNPLFFYGSSGLGKTHLMHAIGNYIEENSNKKVLYVTSEQFTDDFSKINRKDENNNQNYDYVDYFKNKYRNVDVLIIDDIQFLATRPKTQTEFFHTFEFLHHDNKQIIISSDTSPNDLKYLEERLRTRFCWGLTVDIAPPDFELRKNILRKKIQGYKLLPEISEDVIEYIASNLASDVRKLEGAINRLMAYSLTMGYSEITLQRAVEALKDTINRGTSEKTNIYKIQRVVADYYQISVDDLKSKKRSASIAYPRQIAIYICRNVLNESFERIGLEFGGKDHSTVMYSCDKIVEELKNNQELQKTIEKIKENIS